MTDTNERARFDAWWTGEYGPYSLRAEWADTPAAAAWMAWRAQADEIARLRAALDTVMIGGNHLVSIIGVTHPQAGPHHNAALEFYGPGHQYDAWCCWNAIMLARAALAQGAAAPLGGDA